MAMKHIKFIDEERDAISQWLQNHIGLLRQSVRLSGYAMPACYIFCKKNGKYKTAIVPISVSDDSIATHRKICSVIIPEVVHEVKAQYGEIVAFTWVSEGIAVNAATGAKKPLVLMNLETVTNSPKLLIWYKVVDAEGVVDMVLEENEPIGIKSDFSHFIYTDFGNN